MDVPANCALQATIPTAVWDCHETTLLRPITFATKEDKEAAAAQFTSRFTENYAEGKTAGHEGNGVLLLRTLREAATGTLVEEAKKQYPKKASTTSYRGGWGYKSDTWTSRLSGAARSMNRVITRRGRDLGIYGFIPLLSKRGQPKALGINGAAIPLS